MYHYTAWADHGVADPLSLVVFHRQVMRATAQSTGKYTLVHCRYRKNTGNILVKKNTSKTVHYVREKNNTALQSRY